MEKSTLPFVDPYNLSTDTKDLLIVSLVSFKAAETMAWLTKALGKPGGRWWRQHVHRVPLLQEIKHLIGDKKVTKGISARLPKNHKSLLPLQVRGKVLWFQNDSRCVIIAIRDGEDDDQEQALADFHWFLQELSKDFESPDFKDAPEEPMGHKRARAQVPDNLQDLVDKSLKTLEEHQQCHAAMYMPSRLVIRVQRLRDKAFQELRVKSLKRKQTEAVGQDNQGLVAQRQFDMAVHSAISFLESEAPAEGPVAPATAEEDESQGEDEDQDEAKD